MLVGVVVVEEELVDVVDPVFTVLGVVVVEELVVDTVVEVDEVGIGVVYFVACGKQLQALDIF